MLQSSCHRKTRAQAGKLRARGARSAIDDGREVVPSRQPRLGSHILGRRDYVLAPKSSLFHFEVALRFSPQRPFCTEPTARYIPTRYATDVGTQMIRLNRSSMPVTLWTHSFSRHRPAARAVSGASLTITLALLVYLANPQPVLIGVAGLSLCLFLATSVGGCGFQNLAVILAVVVVSAYLWSLDQRVHVVIRTTPLGYLAIIGGNRTLLRTVAAPAGAPRVGLFAGAADSYAVSPLGGVRNESPAGVLGWLGESLRFVSPAPAWDNIRLSLTDAKRATLLETPRMTHVHGTWSTTLGGSLTGSLGASGVMSVVVPRHFVFSANLQRPDGMQGIVIYPGRSRRGYLLAVRMDYRVADWYAWDGRPGKLIASTRTFSVDPIAMSQWIVRTALPSVFLAILLLALAIPTYLLSLSLESVARPLTRRLSRWAVRYNGPRRAAPIIAVAAIVTAAILTGAIAATYLYQRVPNVQDATAQLFQAKTLALGRIYAPAPRVPSFFVDAYVLIEHGHWFSKYPPGWPLLLAVGVIAGAPWLVNPVLTGLGIFLMFLIGRELYGFRIGLLAAGLMLSSPFVIIVSGSYLSEQATWVFLGAAAYLILRWRRSAGVGVRLLAVPSIRTCQLLAMAGILTAFGFMTRQLDTIAFIFPFALILLRRPLAFVCFSLGGLPVAGLYLLYNSALMGNFLGNAYTASNRFDRLGFGPYVGGAKGSYGGDFTLARGLWNVASDLQHLQVSLLGWPYLLALGVASIPFLAGRARKADWLLAAAAACIVLSYVFYFFDAILSETFPRYWYLTIPCLALLVARGLEELRRWPLRTALPLPKNRLAPLVFPVLVLVAGVGYDASFFTPAMWSFTRSQNVNAASFIQAVESRHVHDAVVFQSQPKAIYSWWPYGNVFYQNSPLLNGDIIWARDEGSENGLLMKLYPRRKYYLLDNGNLSRLRFSRPSPDIIGIGRLVQPPGKDEMVPDAPLWHTYLFGIMYSPVGDLITGPARGSLTFVRGRLHVRLRLSPGTLKYGVSILGATWSFANDSWLGRVAVRYSIRVGQLAASGRTSIVVKP